MRRELRGSKRLGFAFGCFVLTGISSIAAANRGLVKLIDDRHISAQRAGVITTLPVKEGQQVKKEELLAEIDATQAVLEAAATSAERKVADEKAKSNVEERFAVASFNLARAVLEAAVKANASVKTAVSEIDIKRLELTAEQAKLKIESSRQEGEVRRLEQQPFAVRDQLAELNVRQRKALSPIDGEIAEVYVQAGEWIDPGKPIARVVRLETLRVETFVRVSERSLKELVGRQVQVHVEQLREAPKPFDGIVTFVSPIVNPGGEYRVWIEVTNRRNGDHWMLRPGLECEVTIAK